MSLKLSDFKKILPERVSLEDSFYIRSNKHHLIGCLTEERHRINTATSIKPKQLIN